LRRAGAFLGEGMLVLERLLAPDARFAVRSLLVDERRLDDAITRLEASGRAGGLPVYVASPDVIESTIGFRFHQGVLALGERGREPTAEETLDAIPPRTGEPATVVVLEDLVDHDNIGSVF